MRITKSIRRPPGAFLRRWWGVAGVLALGAGLLSARARTAEIADQILVKFRPQVSESGAADALRPLRGRQLHALRQIGVRIVRVPAADHPTVLAALRRHPGVEFAETDELVAPDFIPNDPQYASQWHLPMIAAPAAWDLTTGSASVIVAIIDSGVDATHPDLAGLLVPGWNYYNNSSDTTDVFGHGTAVAGAAVAHGNNLTGIASVAWQCRIMPIRVSNGSGSATFSAIALGLTHAANHGARVANVSYAGAARSSTVQTAAAYLVTKGGLTTASAGNGGQYIDEGDHVSVLTVAATTAEDEHAIYSDRGPYVDLSAPGSDIYTTARGGGYESRSGSSFAAPVVAGVAALMFSVNPGLSPAGVEAILKDTAVDLDPGDPDAGYGEGRVDAYQAVLAALALINSPPVPGTFSLGAYQDEPLRFSAAKLLSVARDPDGDGVTLATVSGLSSRGGVVSLAAGQITYTPAAGVTGADAFTYTLSDGRGGKVTGTVSVTVRVRPATSNVLRVDTAPDGVRTIHSIGIPLFSYAVEASPDLDEWTQIGVVVVAPDGRFEFTDPDSNLYPVRFYRTRGL